MMHNNGSVNIQI